ncbi:MAG: FAD/NAD(P)-binding protein [Gammaproteobacteria bacterium]|nr:FAD/NAD(P)-binding protein [Gammaproteobacteria bacterium]
MERKNMFDPYLQHEAEIIERIQETDDIFTIKLRFTDPEFNKAYSFHPGQFNMLYLYGVGEVAISIVSDPTEHEMYSHTIRVVGRMTKGLSKLKEGERIGVRGPFGRGWPVEEAQGKDVVFVTGGLGCAPVVAGINYVVQRRSEYGKLKILQGIKQPSDLIYQDRYDAWRKQPDTEVLLSADKGGENWVWRTGFVTSCIEGLDIDPANSIGMTCGPEPMMRIAALALAKKGLAENDIYLSMERNMHCGIGHCGHCQFGSALICKDGPVFPFAEIKDLICKPGF